jgi:cell division protein FtsW (lipid II flippase)
MITTATPSLASNTSADLRLELGALLVATFVVACGAALAMEARVQRAVLDSAPGIVRTPQEFRTLVGVSIAFVFAGFYGLHMFRRTRRSRGDGLLLPTALVLCGLGVITMIAVRDPLRDPLLVNAFGTGVLFGCAAAAGAMAVNYERLRSFTYLPLAVAIVLSVILFLFGGGPGRSGVKVNLWGGQPVEVIRLLEVAFLAGYLGSRWEYLRSLKDPDFGRTRLTAGLHVPPLDYLLPLLLCLGATLSFYALQKDLGPALIMSCLFLAVYAVACRRIGLAVFGFSSLVAALWLGHQVGLPSTVNARVAIWLAPWDNGLRGGDQVGRGLWSLATGGVTGTGPGLGDAHLVPAAHTDFVLAVIGEELGLLGIVAALGLYTIVAWRAFRIALHASGDYSRFLALGIALGLVLQLLLISGGILGLLPLSGVVTPFISYGKSAMIVNLAGIGVLLSVASRARSLPAEAFSVPVRYLSILLAALGVVVAARAAQIQLLAADETMARPILTVLADGTFRFQDNPRLVAAARDLMPRGRILDRNGLPLAFISGSEDIPTLGPRFAQLGVDLGTACGEAGRRCYPFGGRTYHLLGDARTERDWTASNTSFIERDAAPNLRGYDDRATFVTVPRPDGEGSLRLIRRDYTDLIPLVRYRYRPNRADVQRLASRSRDVRTTIDARLQVGLANVMRERLTAAGHERGAAMVVDATTREVLAAVSYPWPDMEAPNGFGAVEGAGLDRVRYGLYPPGSAFKLVTAIAALRRGRSLANAPHLCERLPDGRIGYRTSDRARPIRDDQMDVMPHGAVTLERGLVVSCNAYFAQLALRLGSQSLYDTAHEFDIAVAAPDTPVRLRQLLPYAGFGQGEVVTSPARLGQVVATIAARGVLSPYKWVLDADPSPEPSRQLLDRAAAEDLRRAMRQVVTSGTARTLRSNVTSIAGKTGTAEIAGQPSHAWFAGFAPYDGPGRRIAFVVLVENGGYGGRTAAPIAGALVDLARQLRIIL